MRGKFLREEGISPVRLLLPKNLSYHSLTINIINVIYNIYKNDNCRKFPIVDGIGPVILFSSIDLLIKFREIKLNSF